MIYVFTYTLKQFALSGLVQTGWLACVSSPPPIKQMYVPFFRIGLMICLCRSTVPQTQQSFLLGQQPKVCLTRRVDNKLSHDHHWHHFRGFWVVVHRDKLYTMHATSNKHLTVCKCSFTGNFHIITQPMYIVYRPQNTGTGPEVFFCQSQYTYSSHAVIIKSQEHNQSLQAHEDRTDFKASQPEQNAFHRECFPHRAQRVNAACLCDANALEMYSNKKLLI